MIPKWELRSHFQTNSCWRWYFLSGWVCRLLADANRNGRRVSQRKVIMISCYKLTPTTTLSSPWNLGTYLSPLTTSELLKGRKRHMTLMVHSAGSAIFSCEKEDDGERSSRPSSAARWFGLLEVGFNRWILDGGSEVAGTLPNNTHTHTHRQTSRGKLSHREAVTKAISK